jgi:hypothetical protein
MEKSRPVWWGQMYVSVGFAAAGAVIGGLLLLLGGIDMPAIQIMEGLMGIGKLIALHLLIKHGTLLHTSIWRYMRLAFGVVILGALFKIQHWPGAGIIVTAGLLAIAILYVIHYATKTIKRWSDHLKALWVVLAFSVSITDFLHLLSWGDYLKAAAFMIFWCAFAAFIRERRHDSAPATH